MLTCAGAEPKQLKALLMEGVSDTDRTVWGLEEELVSGGLPSLDIWICWVTNCTHRDQSALDCLTVPHTQRPVSSGLPHSASYTGTSQHWTASQCIIHIYRDWSVVVTSGDNTYRDWSVVVTHAGTGQWW